MATGIAAVAMHLAGQSWVAWGLFGIGVIAYAVLWILVLLRCWYHRDAVLTDMATHAVAPGFFTVIAATGVLGNATLIIANAPNYALVLWIITLLLWVMLTYIILPRLMEVDPKPTLEAGLNGAWLLIVVSTQAVSTLSALIAPQLPNDATGPILFVALCFWLIGVMVYIWLISLIFYRVMFLPLGPAALTPAYWINMGALAISTLAGVVLVSVRPHLPLLDELFPFLKGMTLLCWATATWWLPMLLVLGAWRHLAQRFPIRYDHSYWAIVFPLGMYSACTARLAKEIDLPFLMPLAIAFAWIAFLAWFVTFVGLLKRTWNAV